MTFRISYLEIYNEVIFDLLSTLPDDGSVATPTRASVDSGNPGLCISEDERGVVSVKGLSLRLATNEEDALNMLFEVRSGLSCLTTQIHVHVHDIARSIATSSCYKSHV